MLCIENLSVPFLADRTNVHTCATMLHPSVSLYIMYCG